MPGPISPDEAREAHFIPEAVFDAVNALLAERFTGEPVRLRLREVEDAIVAAGISRDDLSVRGYLDFEDAYGKRGWRVTFNKPDYSEPSFPSYYEFSPRQG